MQTSPHQLRVLRARFTRIIPRLSHLGTRSNTKRTRDELESARRKKPPALPRGSAGGSASETVLKPGSVPRAVACCGWTPIPPATSLPTSSCGSARSRGPRWASLAKRPDLSPCSGWGLPCHRCHHRRGALLPHRFTLAPRTSRDGSGAVCSLWHFPSSHPDRSFSCTLALRSPDFPPVDDTACLDRRASEPLQRAAAA